MHAADKRTAGRLRAGRLAGGGGLILAATVAIFCIAGCASTDTDMPWNTRQSWEGSPYLPGLSDRN